jgi:hypothetical protein
VGAAVIALGFIGKGLAWIMAGAAIMLVSLSVMRFHGHGKAKHPILGEWEGDLAPLDPVEEREVTVVEVDDDGAHEELPESPPREE